MIFLYPLTFILYVSFLFYVSSLDSINLFNPNLNQLFEIISLSIVMFGFSFLSFYMNCKKERRKNRNKLSNLGVLFEDFKESVYKQEKMFEHLLNLVNETLGLCMWVKDEKDRFVFINKACKDLLFPDYLYEDIINKTDQDIRCIDNQCDFSFLEDLLKNIKPEDLPNLDYSHFKDKVVCNITDVVTRSMKKPCRFYEELGDLSLDVWKNPIISKSGEVTGTVGCLVDITKQKQKWIEGIHYAIAEGTAYRIDSTDQFYITDYSFNSHILSDKLDHTIEKYKRKTQIISKREHHFRTLINSMSIQGYDENRQVIFWTDKSKELYGYSEKEAIGEKLEDLIIPQYMKEDVIEAHNRWITYGEPIPSGKIDLINKNKNIISVYSHHILYEGLSGKEMYCIDFCIN